MQNVKKTERNQVNNKSLNIITMNSNKLFFASVILFFLSFNVCNAQEKSIKPLKGLVKVDDGYFIGITKYENTFECYAMDSLKTFIPNKNLNVAVKFIFEDESDKFTNDLKKRKKDVFVGDIPSEKPVKYFAVMFRIKGKLYTAVFPNAKTENK
jgi:hypothetical protein